MSETQHLCPEGYLAVLQPDSVSPPCGENLEYDADFILLQSRLQTRIGAEYGNFVEAIEPVNWADIERDASALLMRSKDVRLVILLIRCRLRQKGVVALCEGLEALLYMLTQWPDALHPQLYDEGEFVPFMRANAFAELEGAEGFMADFRQQLLPRSGGLQLSIRDVERGYASPREESAPTELTLASMQQAWLNDPAILSLQQAGLRLRQLHQILVDTLDHEAPDFARLQTLLGYFGGNAALQSAPATIAPQEEPVVPQEPDYSAAQENADAAPVASLPPASAAVAPQPAKGIEHRADALSRLREVRDWFMRVEPSSPAVALLAFTEQTIGKNFIELQQLLPAELMAKLDAGQESHG